MTDPLHVCTGIVGFLDAPNHVPTGAIRTGTVDWLWTRAATASSNISALCARISAFNAPTRARIYGHGGMGKTMLVEKLRRDQPTGLQFSSWLRNLPGPRHFVNLAANRAARLRAVAHGARR